MARRGPGSYVASVYHPGPYIAVSLRCRFMAAKMLGFCAYMLLRPRERRTLMGEPEGHEAVGTKVHDPARRSVLPSW